MASSAARNTTPSSIPAAAGSQPGNRPSPSAWSMAGSSRLHTEAAVITPAAKPSMARWNRGFGSPERKNTVAAPRVVIKKVNPVPRAAHCKDCSIAYLRLCFRFGRNTARMTV